MARRPGNGYVTLGFYVAFLSVVQLFSFCASIWLEIRLNLSLNGKISKCVFQFSSAFSELK